VSEEQLVAEQVVAVETHRVVTVRISQHLVEDFWRVDVTGGNGCGSGRVSATVSPGDSFLMNLIEGATSGEPVAWRHLAEWGLHSFNGMSGMPVPRFA
jgi:hypothetical protein